MLRSAIAWAVYGLLRFRYKITVKGFDSLNLDSKRPVMFLPNHPAYVDPIMVLSILGRKFEPGVLIDEDQLKRPLIRVVNFFFPLFPIPDVAKVRHKGTEAIKQTVKTLISELDSGRDLLLYPSGRIYRQEYELVHGTSSVHSILQNTTANPQIVLIRTKGLWGSSMSFGANGTRPHMGFRELFQYLLMIVLNLFFFVPKRKVSIEFCLDNKFPVNSSKHEINRYLESFYNAIPEDRTIIPYYFFKKNLILKNVLHRKRRDRADKYSITTTTRSTVYKKLTELTGIEKLKDEMSLAIDLDMDSLEKAELLVWVDNEFGVNDANTDQINTIEDVLLYAQGFFPFATDEDFDANAGVHADWYSQGSWNSFTAPYEDCDNIVEAMVRKARKHPHRIMLAENGVGTKTYTQFMIGVYVLKHFIKKLEGDKIGFMLPASIAGATAFFAILAAGKTPVMLNWTVGKRNLEHSIKTLGIKKVVTANKLISKLKDQGIDLSGDADMFFPLENLKTMVKLKHKIRGVLVGYLNPSYLLKEKISKTAAILFTSGSENLPKTVPLTQQNVMADIVGVLKYIRIYSKDKLFSFLPPFHSYGLTVDLVLPLISGVPMVLHNNPTQPNIMARIIEKYRPTILVGTPTFLSAIFRRSKDIDLTSLRVAVVGAEKCPHEVFETAQLLCDGVEIMEGYGITECSPIIAVNPYGKSKLGTVGRVLPNYKFKLLDVNDYTKENPDPFNTPSMLIVKGPCVFGGYLDQDVESPFIEFEGEQYYKTGDLVTIDEEGYLSFSGRLKRFIKIGGEMVSLPAIENELIANFKSDDQGISIAIDARETSGRPEIVLFTTFTEDVLTREIANRILKDAGFSGLSNIREVIRIEQIPLLGTGKTNYRALKELM